MTAEKLIEEVREQLTAIRETVIPRQKDGTPKYWSGGVAPAESVDVAAESALAALSEIETILNEYRGALMQLVVYVDRSAVDGLSGFDEAVQRARSALQGSDTEGKT